MPRTAPWFYFRPQTQLVPKILIPPQFPARDGTEPATSGPAGRPENGLRPVRGGPPSRRPAERF
eukprot:761518-Hanusia_phi.AAC.5